MQRIYGPLIAIFILYGAYSKLPNLISLLRSYLGRSTTETPPKSNSTCSFYALTIGINNYPNLEPLKGAAADADRVATFLTTNLRVPPDQVTNLRNQDASREAIIRALQSLRDDSRIANGDPILIYYAGHGGSGKANRRRQMGYEMITNEVQVIFPHDYGVRDAVSGEPINCIPDYTIAEILNDLAETKGDNITVIFDSCHSASGSRDGYEVPSNTLSRCAPVLYDIPSDIDAQILKTAGSRLTMSRAVDPVLCTDQASHVLLAACGSRERAWEQDQQGQFTTALLTTLKARGVDNLTYHNLLVSLPKLANQSPHCYGSNKSRILFNSRISSLKSSYIPVTLEGGILVLGAGAASGVTFRSVWELYDSAANDSQSVGRFTAETPCISSTILIPETEGDKRSLQSALSRYSVQQRLYARQVEAGVGNELKVWLSTQVKELVFQDNGFEKTSHPGDSSHNEVRYVHHPRDGADVGVEVYNNSVEFSLFDPLAERYGVARLDQRKPLNRSDVEPVLFAAAKWNWHLRRTNPQYTEEPNQPLVGMEMYKVGQSIRGNRREFFETPEPLLALYDGNNPLGLVEIIARNRDLYGVRLSNKRSIPLYVKMFFFDATDFSIVHLFGYSTSNDQGDPELAASGDLMIGDGGDGGAPLKFTIPPEKRVELGYLKAFWSTDPLELDDIVQESAFDIIGSSRGVKQFTSGQTMKDWGTICLALVQRSALG